MLALAGGLLVGCAETEEVGEPEVTTTTSSDDSDVAALYDLSCHGQPLPTTAPERLTLRGFTNDSYTGGALPGVMVDLFAKESDVILDKTASDAGGSLSFELVTGNAPVDHYSRMTRDGHVTSYVYPSRPLDQDTNNVFFPVLPPEWRAELAGYAGIDVDPTRGIVAVIVTDCAGERVEGATVAFDPPAEAVAYWDPTFTDASATTTTINGHAWGFNVPAGVVHATVTIGDVTYRDWPVRSFADGRTMSWRAP
jgi:hypothetical protein